MKYFFYLFLVGPVTLFSQNNSSDSSLKIIIIRHGEKYQQGNNLNCKGFSRALHLPAVINKQFGAINLIYVPTIKTGNSTSHDRMFQTATPLAVQDSITINSLFKETDTKHLADTLKTKTGTFLVVWEHTNIPKLGRHLGIKDTLTWKGSDFDSIWIITYPNGINHKPQLNKSTEGLNSLPDSCSFSGKTNRPFKLSNWSMRTEVYNKILCRNKFNIISHEIIGSHFLAKKQKDNLIDRPIANTKVYMLSENGTLQYIAFLHPC